MSRFLAAACLAAFAGAGTAAAADLSVTIDETKMLDLKGQAATMVIGNPAIADVTMQDGDTAFVVGKSYGSTNVIALDVAGKPIANLKVVVVANKERTVTLMRGAQQVTFSCAPRCERTATPGDAPEAFGQIVDQAAKRTGMADAAAAAQ